MWAGETSRYSCHDGPLLSVTLKGRAIVTKGILLPHPELATENMKHHSQKPSVLRPSTSICHWVQDQVCLNVLKPPGGRAWHSGHYSLPHNTCLVLYLNTESLLEFFLSHFLGIGRIFQTWALSLPEVGTCLCRVYRVQMEACVHHMLVTKGYNI